MDDNKKTVCPVCNGTGIGGGRSFCTSCKGTGVKVIRQEKEEYENTAADDYLDYLHDQW